MASCAVSALPRMPSICQALHMHVGAQPTRVCACMVACMRVCACMVACMHVCACPHRTVHFLVQPVQQLHCQPHARLRGSDEALSRARHGRRIQQRLQVRGLNHACHVGDGGPRRCCRVGPCGSCSWSGRGVREPCSAQRACMHGELQALILSYHTMRAAGLCEWPSLCGATHTGQ